MSEAGEKATGKAAGPVASALGLALLAAIPVAFWWGAIGVIDGDLITRRGVPIHPLVIGGLGLAALGAIPFLAAQPAKPEMAGKKGVAAVRLVAFAYVASIGLAFIAMAWGQARHMGMF